MSRSLLPTIFFTQKRAENLATENTDARQILPIRRIIKQFWSEILSIFDDSKTFWSVGANTLTYDCGQWTLHFSWWTSFAVLF